MDRSERRRIRKKQREREKEQEKEQSGDRTKKTLTTLGTVGVAYAGYKYRGQIANTAENVTSKAAERIAQKTGDTAFQQRIQETKNVMGAVSDTYNQERGGATNTFSTLIRNMNPRKRQEAIRKRTGLLNQATQEHARRNNIPEDVKSRWRELKGSSASVYTSAQLRNLESIIDEEGFKDVLGDRKQDLLTVARESTKKRDTDLFRYRGDKTNGEVDDHLLKTIRNYNKNKDVNIDLDFKDDDDLLKTTKAFSDAIDASKRRTSQQATQYQANTERRIGKRNPSNLQGNLYAEEKLFSDMVRFEGVRQRGEENFLQRSLGKDGWRPVTMADAQKRAELRDGQYFLTDSKDGQSIDELFSPARNSKGGLAETFEEIGRNLGIEKPELDSIKNETLFSEDLFLNPDTGELLNVGAARNIVEDSLNFMQDNFQVPVIGVNPLDFLQRTYTRQQSGLPNSAIYRQGDVSSFTGELFDTVADVNTRNDESVGVLARDYFQIGDTIYDGNIREDLLESDNLYEEFSSRLNEYAVDDGYQIMNTRRGVAREMADVWSGRLSENTGEQTLLSQVLNTDPNQETIFDDIKQVVNNFEDASFGQNQPVAITRDVKTRNYDRAAQEIEEIGRKMSTSNHGLSEYSSEYVHDLFAEAISSQTQKTITPEMFQTQEGLLEAAELIAESPSAGNQNELLNDIQRRIQSTFNMASEDPDDFFSREAYDFRRDLFESDWSNVTGSGKPATYTGEDRLRTLLEEFGNVALDQQNRDVEDHLPDNILVDRDRIIDELNDLRTQTEISFFGRQMEQTGTPTARAEKAEEWVDHFTQEDNFLSLNNVMGEIEPFGKKGIETAYESITGTEYMPIRKHRNMLRALNVSYTGIQEGENDLLGPVLSAVGENINTFTGHQGTPTSGSVTPWKIANNLNRRLSRFGLGVPGDQRKSQVGTIGNLFTHRMLKPIIAYQTARSVDDFIFDGGGRRRLAQTYANMHLGMAGVRDRLGITDFSESLNTYIPGMEHLRGSPVGMATRGLSFGLLADDRSEEELQEYYRSGEDPIRKGRWWELGSTTPWIGERIEYYRPNWYRRVMSDYQYTDNMYGSKAEYWSNHWMPNIYNPLAPLNHFVLDPYHYENKHQDSRPYAITGGFSSLQSIPVIGPMVDNVVSPILKPSRENPRLQKAHREYLRAENERFTSAYLGVNSPGLLNVTPKGKISLTTTAPEVNIIDPETGMYDEEALMAEDIRFSSERESIGTGAGQSASQAKGMPVQVTVRDFARNQLASYNTALAGVPESGRTFSPSMIHQQINPYRVQSTDGLTRAVGFGGARSSFIHATDQLQDMGGMFGFISANMLGVTTSDERMRLEDSSQFNSLNRRFWDMNLGGFDGVGGDISEIMRRFIGGKQRHNTYNPIANDMPNWMPGPEYFIDFSHGDPYAKIPYGEIRLPGDAYESIYSVKKDQFGNYSAMDRYRILADVAPYSDQYRLAKSEMAILNQNGLLDEQEQAEYRTIREQVSAKSKKHRFYPKRFGNAEINRETVTIDKVIDQNTFLTKEYPNNPIKLAGVSVKADDTENVQLMRSILKPGSKIQVGLDSDPQNRVRDDMMDTMRAVVYAPGSPFGNGLPLRNGQNVNQFLSNQSEEEGGNVTIKDDGSAVATAALHSEGQITVGRTMEWIAHDLLPNVPFLGVFADKFYPVRTPVREYERLTYGKSFRSWNRPFRDWVVPMLDTATNMNPVVSSIRGAAIGSMFSRNPNNQALFAQVGANVYGTLSGIRSIAEFGNRIFGDGERWVPKRRREQREVDEYFDKLQYIKYKGLYEQAKEMAKQEEGIDLDEYIRLTEEEGQNNSNLQSYLEEQKKWINIRGKSSESETVKDFSREQVKAINESLKQIDDRRPNQMVGSYTALALRYKEEYESTLYGAKDTYDYLKIYRALPKRDKEFFTAFQKASPEERQEILELVPKNQRNIYRQQWGLDPDPEDDVSIDEYFSEYRLPDAGWEGWRPEVSLENIKIKVMQNEGMELTEANYWDEHVDRAEMDPAQPISIQKLPSIPGAESINQSRLKKALEGAGLKDVRIGLQTSASDVSYFNTNLTITRNREDEIQEGIQHYLNT